VSRWAGSTGCGLGVSVECEENSQDVTWSMGMEPGIVILEKEGNPGIY
jgi:hypothetical protein